MSTVSPHTTAGGDDLLDRYLTPDSEIDPAMQPMRWTEDDRLETDPHGLAPVAADADVEEGESDAGEAGRARTGRSFSPTVALRARRSHVVTRKAHIADPGVIRRAAANDTAARKEELATDPAAEAFATRRARFWLLSMAALGIALGVAISAATAQATIVSFLGWSAGSVGYYAAYGADPALGLVLFSTLGARVLASARGVALPETARRALGRIELALFGIIATLTAGPSLGRLAADLVQLNLGVLGPDLMVLVIHLLGPVLVACGVFGVPYMGAILGAISAATTAKQHHRDAAGSWGVTPPVSSDNAPAATGSASRVDTPSRVEEVTADLTARLAAGTWSRQVSAKAIREEYGLGTDRAGEVRDRITEQQRSSAVTQ